MERSKNLRIAAATNFITAPVLGVLSYHLLETARDTRQQIEGLGLGAATLLWLGLGAMNIYNSFDKDPGDSNSTNYDQVLRS